MFRVSGRRDSVNGDASGDANEDATAYQALEHSSLLQTLKPDRIIECWFMQDVSSRVVSAQIVDPFEVSFAHVSTTSLPSKQLVGQGLPSIISAHGFFTLCLLGVFRSRPFSATETFWIWRGGNAR